MFEEQRAAFPESLQFDSPDDRSRLYVEPLYFSQRHRLGRHVGVAVAGQHGRRRTAAHTITLSLRASTLRA